MELTFVGRIAIFRNFPRDEPPLDPGPIGPVLPCEEMGHTMRASNSQEEIRARAGLHVGGAEVRGHSYSRYEEVGGHLQRYVPVLLLRVRIDFVSRIVSARISFGLVSAGSITASTYPRSRRGTDWQTSPGTPSPSRASASLGRATFSISLLKMISAAPFGPITAISAVGQAKLMSPRMCLEFMTSYAPPYAFRVMTVILRDRRLAERVEQLRPVGDDPPPLLVCAREEPGNVLKDDERDVERVAEPHEPRRLARRLDVQHAGENRRLVRDDADGPAREPREPDKDVLRVMRVHLEEIPIVHDPLGSHPSCRTALWDFQE